MPTVGPAPSDLHGRVCVVTGANTGIGLTTAAELARRGAHVVLASRSAEKTRRATDEITRDTGNQQVEFLELDLASFASVRRAAGQLRERDLPIHVLINNAGLAGRGVTADGFEMSFGVNHLGHFLFTMLLLERLRRSAPARVVTVSSVAHYDAVGIDFETLRRPTASRTGLPGYRVSKLANVLFSAELGRRLAGTGVTTYALHPGVIATDIWRRIPWPARPLIAAFMKSADEGAQTTLHCATAADLATESGLYYDKCQPRTPSLLAQDATLARELWRRSEAWTDADALP